MSQSTFSLQEPSGTVQTLIVTACDRLEFAVKTISTEKPELYYFPTATTQYHALVTFRPSLHVTTDGEESGSVQRREDSQKTGFCCFPTAPHEI